MTEKLDVLVSVDDAHLETIEEVSRALEAKGLSVTEVMDVIGVVTGSVEDENVAELRQVEGVLAVERAGFIQLPPPDDLIQ